MLTNAERKAKAALLKDSRQLSDKVAAAQRKPIALAPPNVIDTEIARLERDKEFRRLSRMDPESRRLETLRNIRDREPVEVGKPHPRISKIETLLDAIVSNPERELADYELAVLCLAQHQPGMSTEVADQLWRELQDSETGYLNAKRQAAIDRQSALIQELQAIDVGLAGIADVPAPGHYAILSNSLNSSFGHGLGVSLNAVDHAEVLAAAGNPEAEALMVAKHQERITTYLAAVEADSVGTN